MRDAIIDGGGRGLQIVGDRIVTPDGRELEPGIMSRHIVNLFNKGRALGAGKRLDQTLLLRSLADQLRSREKLGLFVAEALLRLALLDEIDQLAVRTHRAPHQCLVGPACAHRVPVDGERVQQARDHRERLVATALDDGGVEAGCGAPERVLVGCIGGSLLGLSFLGIILQSRRRGVHSAWKAPQRLELEV